MRTEVIEVCADKIGLLKLINRVLERKPDADVELVQKMIYQDEIVLDDKTLYLEPAELRRAVVRFSAKRPMHTFQVGAIAYEVRRA